MQPKNSSKTSLAKAVLAKYEDLNIINKTTYDLKINGKQVFCYINSPTSNCQIQSLTVLEPELLYIFSKQNPEYFKLILGKLRNTKPLLSFTFRTKFMEMELLMNLGKELNETNFFINKEKFTNKLIYLNSL